MRNILILAGLSFIYFIFLQLRSFNPFLFVTAAPIVIGILGYSLTKETSVVKRFLAASIPWLSLVWVFIFSDIENQVGIVLFHSFIIGMLIVQLWEIIESCFVFFKKSK
jgi:hypothetical protein